MSRVQLTPDQIEFINLNSEGYANAMLNTDRYIKIVKLLDLKKKTETVFSNYINGKILCEKILTPIEIYNKYFEDLTKEQIKDLFYSNE